MLLGSLENSVDFFSTLLDERANLLLHSWPIAPCDPFLLLDLSQDAEVFANQGPELIDKTVRFSF